jgi:FKBP-type peptidyl-prolyl cis-trans isomerase FklB
MLSGQQTRQAWKQQDVDLDPEAYARGIKDGVTGADTLLTTNEAVQAFNTFRTEFTAKQQQKRLALVAKNKADGDMFLLTNKINSGIKLLSVALPTGQTSELQYLILTNGTGAVPVAGDTVTVNYRGTLLDDTEFDSSYKAGHPITFEVGKVIPGWTAALEKMPVGSKWKLFIPAELAYGAQGTRGIPPNSVLIFEVELLNTQATAPTPAVTPLTSDIIRVPSKAELDKGAKPETLTPEDVKRLQAEQK